MARYACGARGEAAVRWYFRYLLHKQPEALAEARRGLKEAKATWPWWSTEWQDDMREEIECRLQLLDALLPYEAPTQEELQTQVTGNPVEGVSYRDLPFAGQKLHADLLNSPLLPVPDAKLFMSVLLGAHGASTWEHAVRLTHRSPCFRAIPDWLVVRCLAIIERMQADDARASLAWTGRVLSCAAQWASDIFGVSDTLLTSATAGREHQESRKGV
eukprot:TRINITY_DN2328_c0_g1_i1.p1 TRINITY_DN2328_c0_g1~~TRINITY_DN2328_c0_g1_i1.p1  ORF type:complete len:225 (+),score=15.38 TRINITY_DN2328_c0_g1_i1:29-676(+)